MSDSDVSSMEQNSGALFEELMNYLKTANEINQQYIDIMKEVVSLSQKAHVAEEQLSTQKKIGSIKKKIRSL